MNRTIAIALFLSAFSASAAVYRTVDEQGNVVFSDQPAKGAEKVDLPPVPTYQAPRYKLPAAVPDSGGAAEPAYYTHFALLSPTPDETLRDNTGKVQVTLGLEPALNGAAGHRIQFYLDGRPVGGPGSSLQTVLTNIDRGEHEVSAAVIDRTGKEIVRTGPVRFFLHRHSVNFPSGPQPAPKAPRP